MNATQQALAEDNIKFAVWKAKKWSERQDDLDVEELISIAYLSICKAANAFDPERKTKFISFASLVIDNDIKSELKKANKYRNYGLPDVEDTEGECIEYESQADLKIAISKLPELHRDMLLDFYEQGLNQYEIADKYHVSQTKVSTVLKKAKELIALSI